MLFPVSGIEVSQIVPVITGFYVSLFTSVGGISGAFLLLPFQMSVLGYTSPAVSATNQVFNIVAIPSGVYRYLKEGRMVWPLTIAVAVGTLPGVFIGAWIRVVHLPDPRPFKLFVACVLLYIGSKLVHGLVTQKIRPSGTKPNLPAPKNAESDFTVTVREFSLARIAYTFQNATHSCPTVAVFALSLVVGIIGGIYGIGGGAIMAPFIVSFFRLPVHTISGAALMGTFLTSIAGVTFYTLLALNHPEQSVAPDWILGALFGIGGAAGMYCGACCQKYVPATGIRAMLAVSILGTACKYVLEYLR
ncbi:MAG: sulfite exporter TauE/SafE family protein [Candidatus Desulfovibrio kirbyi]|uniref:Probable membrane transporter protein n=1 Tax=Candidatus Desulfovibrio kirbyi TaxID=2696086 RepID=A0A6L2R736_9BACT|nr:MAG: sulfite exporter TauE/SafE family protein [Candidatus Desulfovibrio kirbyi]